jgi:ParB family chromosome partitioning protein
LVEQDLIAEGWGWVQVDRDRDWKVTQGCSRLEPEPVDAPEELLAELKKLEAEQLAIGEQIDATDDEDEIDRLNDRNNELETRLDDLADKIAAYARFAPDQMATAGCYAYIGNGGKLEVEKGLVRRQDTQKAAKAPNAAPDADEPAEKPKGLSQSLIDDLKAYRLGVAQAEIAKHPAIAFDLLVFRAAKGVLELRSGYDGPNVAFNREFGGNASKDARDFIREQMEPIAKALPRKWLEEENEDEQFVAFQKLTVEQKHALLAYAVAATLRPKLAPEEDDSLTAYDIALSQTGANVADHWRPTKDNYLSRVTKDHLLEIGKEIVSGERGETWARNNANAKKGDIATELHKMFADPERYGVPSEQLDRVKGWLPKGMAFGQPPEPKTAKSKKGKKAA